MYQVGDIVIDTFGQPWAVKEDPQYTPLVAMPADHPYARGTFATMIPKPATIVARNGEPLADHLVVE